MDKIHLRKQAKEKRKFFFSTCSPQNLFDLEVQRITALWHLPLFQNFLKEKKARLIGLYNAIGEEASTTLLTEKLLEYGLSIALPRLTEKEVMTFCRWTPDTPLIKSPLGLLEPEKTLPMAIPDLCIVPLLAFDQKNARLGYGKGYYDRYFAQHPQIIKIGWAYGCQRVDNLESEPHDIPLDDVIYGSKNLL